MLRFRAAGEQRATSVELFFDLVFVFAITQLSTRLKEDLRSGAPAGCCSCLLVVWWAWIYTAWMTNWFDPGHLSVRLVLIACMLAAFLMAIAIPDAFGIGRGLFAGGYVALQWSATRSSCWRPTTASPCAPRGCGCGSARCGSG